MDTSMLLTNDLYSPIVGPDSERAIKLPRDGTLVNVALAPQLKNHSERSTLVLSDSKDRSKAPRAICTLIPRTQENSTLSIQLVGGVEYTFSVSGPNEIHLLVNLLPEGAIEPRTSARRGATRKVKAEVKAEPTLPDVSALPLASMPATVTAATPAAPTTSGPNALHPTVPTSPQFAAPVRFNFNPFVPKPEPPESQVRVQVMRPALAEGREIRTGDAIRFHYRIASEKEVLKEELQGTPSRYIVGSESFIRGFDVGLNGARLGNALKIIIPYDVHNARVMGRDIPKLKNSWCTVGNDLEVDIIGIVNPV
ncbi:hypothetical protein H0H93_013862 [Arthromyces matolae]|nr:hypothetical protein H0H93_013862 [Arthromyces matolae]